MSGIDAVVVATSNRPGNNDVISVARAAGVKVFRGSEGDVLDRVNKAAVLHGFAHIACLKAQKKSKADYTKTISIPRE